jgi:methylphosphotriester-DNA--protein-cysteine methyltransferase
MTARTYTLLGPDRQPYQSATSGALGGYRPGRVYGRLDCPAALRAIARGGYVRNRVFFADEQTAVAAGYRPCAVCLPDEYARWKAGSLSEVGAADALGRLPSRQSTDVRLEG